MAGTIDLAKQAEALTALRLNGVRPRWPEQYGALRALGRCGDVSMESGLDGRNNPAIQP